MALPEPVFTSASVLAALSEDKHQTVTNIAKAVLRARGYTYTQYVQDISTERSINENLVTRMVDRTVVHILMTLERDGLVEESANRYRKVSADGGRVP